MSLSFACKRIDFQDIVMCSFDLNKTEYHLVLFLLQQKKSLSASDIGKRLQKDRTTVQKAMKHLAEKHLVKKHQINLQTGGYTFVYAIQNKEELRQRIITIVSSWQKKVLDSIKKW